MKISDTSLILTQPPILPTHPFLWEKSDTSPPIFFQKLKSSSLYRKGRGFNYDII